jgi:integrase/recombinase XerD
MTTLAIATKDFITHCKIEKNLSVKTLKAYEIDLRQLNEFFVGKKYSTLLTDVSKIELREYLESIITLKPKSIKRKVATMKTLFNFLEFEDQISINPIRKMRIKIREEKKLPKALSIREVGDIFKVAYSGKLLYARNSYAHFESLRNIVIVELLFATGARVSEISNIKDENIDLESGEVLIHGKGNKERIVQICNKETLTALKQYRKLSLDKIKRAEGFFIVNRFNNKISEQSIRHMVKSFAQKANIQMNVTPHVFRHSFATLLLEQDVDIKYIQSFLGHSSITTTQVYTHVNREKQKEILSTKHPRKAFSSRKFTTK